MLILTRRVGESLMIGDNVTVTVLGVKGNQVRIGVNAPKEVADMLGVSVGYLMGTARQIHPDVVDFLKETPEAAEFMVTAMNSGLAAEDFADLREALKDKSGGKGFVRRATVPASKRLTWSTS